MHHLKCLFLSACLLCQGCTLFLDRDGDGHLNHADNCPNWANPQQQDIDGDGRGDVCDPCSQNSTKECLEAPEEEVIYGCLDAEACNFNAQATKSDGSCVYILEGECDCDGNVVDCAGTCGGIALIDCAGTCGGIALVDCAGTCGGIALVDCAGTCGGIALVDCAGTCGGIALVDCAGTCDGSAIVDCAGTCNGTSSEDECGVCGGGGITPGKCDCDGNERDCADQCGGDAIVDCAGNCDGGAELDCLDVCAGTAGEDACGVCEGDNSTCSGCMDEDASNYDAEALVDDGSCIPYDLEFSLCPVLGPETLNNTVNIYIRGTVDLGHFQLYFDFVEEFDGTTITTAGGGGGVAAENGMVITSAPASIIGYSDDASQAVGADQMSSWVLLVQFQVDEAMSSGTEIIFSPAPTSQVLTDFAITVNYIGDTHNSCEVE
jgi:hypothetical protein